MTKSLSLFNNSSSKVNNNRWQPYLLLGIVANAAIWGSAFFVLQFQPPAYKSSLNVILPGTSDGAVSVPNVGNATYQNLSAFSQDTRATYSIIATSQPVVTAAAKQLNIPLKSFSPDNYRIKLVPNTTMMTFETKAATPKEAEDKTLAIYQAFQTRLNVLRAQETLQREAGFQSALSSAQQRLEIAQKRLSDYKASSGLNSNAQVVALSNNIDQLRAQKTQLLVQEQQTRTRLKELSKSLNPSAQQAESASLIETDQIFQQNFKLYNDTSAALVDLSSIFLPDHPAVVAQKARQDAAQKAMLARSQYLLGRPINQATLKQLNPVITNGSARELITLQADLRALQSQSQETNQQIIQLEGRLKSLAKQETTLDAFTRDFKVAEAVFTSTLGKLDVGKSNVFGSYPLIQTLSTPTLGLSSPIQNFVLVGASLGSLLITTGITTLWLRKRKIWTTEAGAIATPDYKKNNVGFPERNVESPSL